MSVYILNQLPHLQSLLAGTDHAKSRRNTETLLSSSDDDVDSPVIEADLLGGYGADTVENDLCGAAKVSCRYAR
jgi:hypothetical protein